MPPSGGTTGVEKVTSQTYYVRAHIYQSAQMTATWSQLKGPAGPEPSLGYIKPPGTDERVPNTETLPTATPPLAAVTQPSGALRDPSSSC